MEKINSKLYMENCYMHNGGEREAKEEGRGFEQGESGTPERAKEEEL